MSTLTHFVIALLLKEISTGHFVNYFNARVVFSAVKSSAGVQNIFVIKIFNLRVFKKTEYNNQQTISLERRFTSAFAHVI